MEIRNIILLISCLLFFKVSNSQVDTIEIYLEDSCFYRYESGLSFSDVWERKDTTQVYNYLSSGGVYYFLVDSLDDGFYEFYDIYKEDVSKINKSDHLVITGAFQNNKREGVFTYRNSNVFKMLTFKKGVVHGKVIEYLNDRILYSGEYKNGKKHGYFFFQEREGRPQYIQISYYENGERVNFETFSVEEWYNWD
jgi:hypothetical protein